MFLTIGGGYTFPKPHFAANDHFSIQNVTDSSAVLSILNKIQTSQQAENFILACQQSQNQTALQIIQETLTSEINRIVEALGTSAIHLDLPRPELDLKQQIRKLTNNYCGIKRRLPVKVTVQSNKPEDFLTVTQQTPLRSNTAMLSPIKTSQLLNPSMFQYKLQLKDPLDLLLKLLPETAPNTSVSEITTWLSQPKVIHTPKSSTIGAFNVFQDFSWKDNAIHVTFFTLNPDTYTDENITTLSFPVHEGKLSPQVKIETENKNFLALLLQSPPIHLNLAV